MLRKVVRVYGLTGTDVLFGDDDTSGAVKMQGEQVPATTNDLPVYRCSQGAGGTLMISAEVIQLTERPAPVRQSRFAFGLYCDGDDMAPVFERRDLIIIDPARPVREGDDVLFVKGYEAGSGKAFSGLLRRLVRITDSHWTVRQYNPPGDHKVLRSDFEPLFVFGKYSR